MAKSLSTFIVLIGSVLIVTAQEPILHLRADSLVVLDSAGRVPEWSSVTGDAAFRADTGYVAPEFVSGAMNGRPALRFANDGYLEGPSIYPVRKDYSLYVVMNWEGSAASNNLVSGTSHALYLSSSPYPRLLHAANFSQQVVGTSPVSGPTIIRATYQFESGAASISVNNGPPDEAVIPVNTDGTCLIGSYARGNFFWGDIAEVVLFDRLLDNSERTAFEQELHDRYSIQRIPDPPPPVVRWDIAPRNAHFVPEGGSIVLRGEVLTDSVERLDIVLDSAGIEVDRWVMDAASVSDIDITRSVYPGLHFYHLRATADLANGSTRAVLDAGDMVCGVAIAIEGQSNSIFGDVSQAPSQFARTFGSNNGRVAGDTIFKPSVANGNGGGANVGAWGLRLQNLMASELGVPSCVINGGVGGTRIELHFPNATDRQSLTTIYGSWLYRLEKSGLREHIRWLFWYQGESNSGADGYADLFGTLYRAWKDDLPNLEHVVVIQIRPGCGGTEHALLRDDQRRLQDLYDDVIVHTACALPGHDGCHFQSTGYRLLGDQLFRIYRDLEAGASTSPAVAPTIHRARQDVETGAISLTMKNASTLYEVNTTGRPLTAAFFFDGDEALHPDSVWIRGSTVVLQPPSGVAPVTVSYVPSKNDATTNALYQGPWLTDEVGVGLLTFHEIPVIASSVEEEAPQQTVHQIFRRGDAVEVQRGAASVTLTSIGGATIALSPTGDGWTIPRSAAPGSYVLSTTTTDGVVHSLILVTE